MTAMPEQLRHFENGRMLMRNSKKIFLGIAIILALACILAFLLFGPGSNPDNSPGGSETAPVMQDDTTYPTAPLPTEPTKPDISVANTVTIHQVEKDPNEVIDTTTNFTEDHPEYIPFGHDNPICCAAGCVFRNDKTISITIPDTLTDTVHKIKFGMITGRCNRFLYLNPTVESTESGPWLFHFQTVGGGSILTINEESEDPIDNFALTMHRTLDNTTNAQYNSPQNPGAVWYTQAPKDGPFYINCLVLNRFGDFCAIVQLTIDRAEDGTYSIVDLDNRDLRYAEHELYTESELEYLLGQVNEVINDKEQVHFLLRGAEKDQPVHITWDEVFFDLRDKDTKLYFMHFVPVDINWKTRCDHYTSQLIPIIGVTVRRVAGERVCTLYFQVLEAPYKDRHGTYIYIGRDYTQYDSTERLIGASYPGGDLYG